MKTVALIIFSIFISVTSWARKTDGQFIFSRDQDFLLVTPKKGFHLNKDAPASVVFDELEALYKPTKKSDQLFEFKIVKGAKKAKLAFYMCDDKNTVCEQQQETVLIDQLKTVANGDSENGGQSYKSAAEAQTENALIKKPGLAKHSEKAANQPMVLNPAKPTLYLFSAPWCPACLRMESETLNKPSIKQELKKVNFVKLNSDLPDNHELSEKFKVKAIPTMVLVDKNGEELYRWLDFQEANQFKVSLNKTLKEMKDSKDTLIGRAKIGDQDAISQLGLLAYNALDCTEALKWLHLSKDEKDQKFKLAADVMCAEETSDHEGTLLKAMTLTTSQVDRLRWFVDYVELLKEKNRIETDVKMKSQKILEEVQQLQKNQNEYIQAFKQSTYGETKGFEWAELQLMRVRLNKVLGQDGESQKLSAELIQKLKIMPTTVDRPGEMLLQIAYLREAGEKNLVEKLYKKLIQKYSKSYVYFEKYSRYLLTQKRYDESMAEAEKALKFPEGNRPQLYLLKTRIYRESNNLELAKKTIQEAMGLSEINHPRYKKIVTQIQKIDTEIKSALK